MTNEEQNLNNQQYNEACVSHTIFGYFKHGGVKWLLVSINGDYLQGIDITPKGVTHTLNINKSQVDELTILSTKQQLRKTKTMIKKTLSIRLGRENYAIALMRKNGWKEIDRNTIGGQMSEERLQITFEGYDVDYQENDYIKVISKEQYAPGFFTFYSLRRVDGVYTNSLEIFKAYHDEANMEFDVHSFGVV